MRHIVIHDPDDQVLGVALLSDPSPREPDAPPHAYLRTADELARDLDVLRSTLDSHHRAIQTLKASGTFGAALSEDGEVVISAGSTVSKILTGSDAQAVADLLQLPRWGESGRNDP